MPSLTVHAPRRRPMPPVWCSKSRTAMWCAEPALSYRVRSGAQSQRGRIPLLHVLGQASLRARSTDAVVRPVPERCWFRAPAQAPAQVWLVERVLHCSPLIELLRAKSPSLRRRTTCGCVHALALVQSLGSVTAAAPWSEVTGAASRFTTDTSVLYKQSARLWHAGRQNSGEQGGISQA
jgi:hypothetical protein